MYNCTTNKIKFLNQYLINSMHFNCNSNSHSNTQYTTTSSSTEYTTAIHNTQQPALVQNTQLQYTIHNNHLQYTIHNSQNSNSHIKFVPINQLSPQQLFLHQICTQTHSTHIKFLQPTEQINYTQYSLSRK